MAVQVLSNKIIATPNNSLTHENGVRLLVAMLLVMLVITLSFARMGAWLVLPFAGLELIAFCIAFYTIYLHANDYESVTVDEENVLIEQRNNKAVSSKVFKRYWAQVYLRRETPAKGIFAKSKIIISSHGQEVEFGNRLVSEEQRIRLVKALKQIIKNIT